MRRERKLKIGVVIDQLLAGGVQLAAIEQVRELRKLGHPACLLILMRKKYATDFSYLVKDIPYQYLSDSYPSFLQKPIKFPIFSFFSTLHLLSPILASSVIKTGAYDILISHGTTTCLTTQALWRVRKIPYIAIIHDPMVYIFKKVYQQTFLKYFFPLLLPLAKFIECSFAREAKETLIDSQVHSSYIKKNYGIIPKVLPLGCKTLVHLPKRRGDYLLSFGRWQKEKNPQFLLKLLKALPKAKLVLAGSWTNQEDLERFRESVRRERLKKRIKIITRFNEGELEKICAQSRLWLHAHFEAFSLAALEAAGHGLPIIIPEKSGITEILKDGVCGFFPKKIDLREYKKYIKRLLGDERLAYRIGKTAWKVVKRNYSWEVNVQKLLEIVQASLGILEKPSLTVLEIGHSRGTSLGGGDKLMEPMAKRLADRYVFTVITSRVGASHWLKAPFEKKMMILPRNKFDGSGEPVPVFLTYCLRIWQARKILKKALGTNILYSSTNILPDVLPAYSTKGSHPKIVWIARVHHLIPPPYKREGRPIVNIVSYLMQALALWMIKHRADIIIALNQGLKNSLLKRGFPKNRLLILGAGVELEEILGVKPTSCARFDGVFLGRLHPAKGVFDAVPIWNKVAHSLPQARLAIIGDGPLSVRYELQADIQRARLSDKISLLGFLSSNEIYSLMKQAKVFLFLDHEAGWGLAIGEAMACGLPIVGYNIGVLGDTFKRGFLTVPNFNKHLFSKKIINLLKNESLRHKLSHEAITQAKQLDWNQTTLKFKEILSGVREGYAGEN